MIPVKKPVSRWITIGEVERRSIRLGNCVFPNALCMQWRGRVDWCQPFEFVKWENVEAAIRTRLDIASMNVLGIVCLVPQNAWDGLRPVRVHVCRQTSTKEKV